MSQNHSAQWPFGLAAVGNYTTSLDTRMQCYVGMYLNCRLLHQLQLSGAPFKEGGNSSLLSPLLLGTVVNCAKIVLELLKTVFAKSFLTSTPTPRSVVRF